jgi:hypothetical protein
MAGEEPTLETAEALKASGVSMKDWTNALHRGHYHHAPPVHGNARSFTIDDLVAARIFGVFLSVGASTYWAGLVGHRVLEALAKNPRLKKLSVWRVEHDGKPDVLVQPTAPPGGSKIIDLPIDEYRRDCRRALREKVKQEG